MPALDDISGTIIECAIAIHSNLRPGLFESVYELLPAHLLTERGLGVERRKPIPVVYRGVAFGAGFRADLVVEVAVIVELESVEQLAPVHANQLLTYLRLAELPVGFLINFGDKTLKGGVRRLVNHLPPSASPRLRVNRQDSER